MTRLEPVRAALESEQIDRSRFEVHSARWHESLGGHYRARVELETDAGDFDAPALAGADVCLVLSRGDQLSRRLCGLVTEVAELGLSRPGRTRLRLEIQPALAQLDQRHRSRIFQNKSALEIALEVLGAELGTYGRSFTDETVGEYAVREYCVQYQESDLAFVSRLFEEEGIWFSFDHEGATEVVLVRDRNGAAAPIEGANGNAVQFARSEPPEGVETIFLARLCAASTVTDVAVRRFDWTSVQNRDGEHDTGEPVGPAARYEHGHPFAVTLADFRGGRFERHDAAERARVAAESLRGPHLHLRGSSVVIGMTAGRTFALGGHPIDDANTEYLVVTCRHRFGIEQDDARYENEIEAQPMERVFRRARLTPRPIIRGLQTAFVVGPPGEEIHTDEHGRIKVQFHWDRDGKNDAQSSCFLRCAQVWASAGWGFVWTPRIGMEVLVAFEDGNPDRPLAVEALYDGDHPPPYALPDEKTRSTIKSASSPGEAGFNELRFEDKAGAEEVFLHAQKDLDEVVLANHSTNVGASQSNEVMRTQTQKIGGKQTETIGTDQDLDVTKNRLVDVRTGFEESITGSETRVVQVGATETIADGETHVVTSGGLNETIGGGEKRKVKGGLWEDIAGGNTFTATGAVDETVSGSMLRKGSSITIDASTAITMTGTSGIEIKGFPKITVKSPQWTKNTARQSATITKDDEAGGLTIMHFGIIYEVGGLKDEAIGSAALEATAIKGEMVATSVGVAGVSLSILGLKHELSGAEFKGNVLKLIKAAFTKIGA